MLAPLFDTGFNIPCEKPLATSIPDARWIVARATEPPGVFWTAMDYRQLPLVAVFIRPIHAVDVGALRMLSLCEHRIPFLPKVGDANRFAADTAAPWSRHAAISSTSCG